MGDIKEKFNIYQRFFSYFSPSNHTTFSQTQTGVTVPLRNVTVPAIFFVSGYFFSI
jgi:hypothetical protein